jgi:hypothetical protein
MVLQIPVGRADRLPDSVQVGMAIPRPRDGELGSLRRDRGRGSGKSEEHCDGREHHSFQPSFHLTTSVCLIAPWSKTIDQTRIVFEINR